MLSDLETEALLTIQHLHKNAGQGATVVDVTQTLREEGLFPLSFEQTLGILHVLDHCGAITVAGSHADPVRRDGYIVRVPVEGWTDE